jgi:hypothetical protein
MRPQRPGRRPSRAASRPPQGDGKTLKRSDSVAVMAGLVPAIHVFDRAPNKHVFDRAPNKDVDARHKAGHDDSMQT